MTNRQFALLCLVLCSAFIVGLVGCSSPQTDDDVRLRETIAILETQVSNTSTPKPVSRATSDGGQKDSGRVEETATVSDWTYPLTPTPAVSGKINGKKIHLRQAPSLDYEKWVHVPFGTEFSVVGRTPDGEWIQLCCVEGEMGWVRRKYVDLSTSDWTSVPTTPQLRTSPLNPTPKPTSVHVAAPTPDPQTTILLPDDCIFWNTVRNNMKGKNKCVCGPVVSSNYATGSKNKPTFLNIGNPYPNDERVTIVIWDRNRRKFPSNPESYYLRKNICVAGKIYIFEGVPQIEARNPSQIGE